MPLAKILLPVESFVQESWQTVFLDGLIKLDESEGPHGLYGIRWAYAQEPNKLPTLGKVLQSPKHTGFIKKLFKSNYSYAKENTLAFTTCPTHQVELRLFDYASTKVRHFGSSYQLDLHNRKQPLKPQWNLERLIPKLARHGRHGYRTGDSHSILLIAHAKSLEEIHALVGRARDQTLLASYSVSLMTREWKDRYGRGFYSALYLWTGGQPA